MTIDLSDCPANIVSSLVKAAIKSTTDVDRCDTAAALKALQRAFWWAMESRIRCTNHDDLRKWDAIMSGLNGAKEVVIYLPF